MKREEQVKQQLDAIKYADIEKNIEKTFNEEFERLNEIAEDSEPHYCPEGGTERIFDDVEENARDNAIEMEIEEEFYRRGGKALRDKYAFRNLLEEKVDAIYIEMGYD